MNRIKTTLIIAAIRFCFEECILPSILKEIEYNLNLISPANKNILEMKM